MLSLNVKIDLWLKLYTVPFFVSGQTYKISKGSNHYYSHCMIATLTLKHTFGLSLIRIYGCFCSTLLQILYQCPAPASCLPALAQHLDTVLFGDSSNFKCTKDKHYNHFTSSSCPPNYFREDTSWVDIKHAKVRFCWEWVSTLKKESSSNSKKLFRFKFIIIQSLSRRLYVRFHLILWYLILLLLLFEMLMDRRPADTLLQSCWLDLFSVLCQHHEA